MTTLEIICLYGLGISLCLLLFDAAGKTLRAAWRRNGRRYGVAASLIGLAVVCTINAQKPGPTPVITVDAFLRDAGSYATNDVLHVAVTNAPAYAGIDFSSCPVLVYARQRGLSDAPEWEELLPRRTFSELPADYAIEDATNYNYLVYLDYVPPSPVHTNGVFELRGFVVPDDEPGNLEQLAAGFINSRAILPPPTARDYVQDGLIAMWDGIDHGNDPLIWRDLSGNGYDATQRVANAGWSWGNNAYIGTANNGHGFRTPIAIVNDLREHIDGHTIEIVYLPSNSSRQTIFGQYKVAEIRNGGLNIEYSPHQPGWFRVYYSASPDFNTPAWKKTQSRLTCAVVCDENDLRLYENGVHTSTAAKPEVGTIGYSKPFIIGGENERSNISIVGELFCVRVYSRALTEEELKHHVKIDNERFNLP